MSERVWHTEDGPYDKGRLDPGRLREEIKQQQRDAGAEWTTTPFVASWSFAHDVGRISERLAEFATITCTECRQSYDWSRMSGGVQEARAARPLCFDCRFWMEKVAWAATDMRAHDGLVARMDGRHYVVHPDLPARDRDCAGMAGRPFHIRWTSGPLAGLKGVTRNLWFQGEIPERFRDRLPDNAEPWTDDD